MSSNDAISRVFVRLCSRWMPDVLYLRILYRLNMKRRLHLSNPRTFSEKMQWLKLYNHHSDYTMMVDKNAVKEYVAQKIGDEYIIPTLGIWEKPEDIAWNTLPNSFVLKTTHGGGSAGVVICKDLKCFNKADAIRKLNNALRQDIARTNKEWPYKNVPRRIIAEKYIEPASGLDDLLDYKFFCFNGEPKFCQVISGRETIECSDFFDHNWVHQPFHEPHYLPFSEIELEKPPMFEKMWQASKRLAEGMSFSRVDFYSVGDQVYFGEITFFPTSGFGGFEPECYDEIVGGMVDLPTKNK